MTDKMWNTLYRLCLTTILLVNGCLLVFPFPAKADGGPVVGPHLWAQLKEGQQIAVVTLKDTNSAEVDLFVSMLDNSGESHEVVFFVPLGVDAADFRVVEKNSVDFDEDNTEGLDLIFRENAQRQHQAIESLFAGTLLVNGVWLLPFWLPMLLSGCAVSLPEATFETDSSQVSIFGLDDDTDIEALISTTGLDPSVRGSLSRLQGQRIAVVTLQTQPRVTDTGSDGRSRDGEPGIHLSWTTAMIPGENGATYSYPLGTGDSWSHPIEMTRIYVFAPPGINFSAHYPELGVNRSGFTRRGAPRIADYYQVPAYAVDEAVGDFGHIWRATYTQSNSAEDIVILARPQSLLSKIYIKLQGAGKSSVALILGFIMALASWLLGWRYLMPRLLAGSYQGHTNKLLKYALIYTGINIVLMLPGMALYFFWSWTGSALTFIPLLILFGGASILIFAVWHLKRLGTNTGQAIKAFVLVTLASNGAYLLFSLVFAKLTGVI
jgi:hypothetical protein